MRAHQTTSVSSVKHTVTQQCRAPATVAVIGTLEPACARCQVVRTTEFPLATTDMHARSTAQTLEAAADMDPVRRLGSVSAMNTLTGHLVPSASL